MADAVKVTLGLKGRNVVMDKSFGAPELPKTVNVAKEIELKDKVGYGRTMVRDVASKTNDIAGDGTASTCAYTTFTEGMKAVARNESNGFESVDLAIDM